MTLRYLSGRTTLLTLLIAGVWIFHGLYSKVLSGIPRHQQIVGRILGENIAQPATLIIGILEVLLGIWVLTRWKRVACASVQTIGLISMNIIEIALAKELLISASGMVFLNAAFLTLVWIWAKSPAAYNHESTDPARLPHSAKSE